MDHSKLIGSLGSELHRQIFKEAGFKKQANSFTRWTADGYIAHVVDLQAGSYAHFADATHPTANKQHGSFTIDVSVYIPRVAMALGKSTHNVPKEPDCQWRNRIGFLRPDPADEWFPLSTPTPVVAQTIVERSWPYLALFSSKESLIANTDKFTAFNSISLNFINIILAVAHFDCGDVTRAQEALRQEEELRAAAGKRVVPSVERIAKNVGLPL